MIHDKTVLAIIPARSGSKGLPGKNIKTLCGKPLVAWSIEAGLACKYIDEVMVTTDSKETAEIALKFGASVPFIRPIDLATDGATSIDTVKHAITFYKKVQGKTFDYIVLLEPTSPLREYGDLDSMLETVVLSENDFDAIISLGLAREYPSIMKKLVGRYVLPLNRETPPIARRQDNEATYFPYGVAYIVKTTTLLAEETFHPERTTFHLLKREQCIEIDDLQDFLEVERIMKEKGK